MAGSRDQRLTAVTPMRVAAAHMVGTRLRTLERRIVRYVETPEPESLHDVRVAARRLRVCLQCCAAWLPQKRAREALDILRTFFKQAGRVREAHVFEELIDEWAAQAARGATARAALRAVLERLSAPAVDRLRSAADSLPIERIARLLRLHEPRTADPDAESAGAAAFGVVIATARRVRKRAFALLLRRDLDMHRLRIAIKRLRYTIDVFAFALTPQVTAMSALAAHVQAALGRHHDLEMLRAFVEQHAPRGVSVAVLGAWIEDQQSLAHDEARERFDSLTTSAGWRLTDRSGVA